MQLTYDLRNRVEPSKIYLAKPGHRILGVLNGIKEETCNLELNLNNTFVLSFDIDRIVDGELSSYYEIIGRYYELYVTNFGWFKINEEPEVNGDGNTETMSIRAESNEIELQQYDLVDFEVNTASVSSKEMLAIDNTYLIDGYDDYTMFHNQVLFYRDTTDLEALTQSFKTLPTSNQTLDNMISLWENNYPNAFYYENSGVFSCWRLAKDKNGEWNLDLSNQDSNEDLTIIEFLEQEIRRMHELSLLWLILHEHGWSVGTIDDWFDIETETVQTQLWRQVGQFAVDTKDIYSFITQEVSSYFKCIFTFDTENYKVNAYRVENLGFDTNIMLSFHNVQNNVTRSSGGDLYTVFTVSNGDADYSVNIREANLGSDRIEDISYFLNTDHFTNEFIQKYNNWQQIRQSKRQEYMDAAVQLRNKQEEADEIKNRVPLDGADTSQYSTMTDEELLDFYNTYNAQMIGIANQFLDDEGEIDEDALEASREYSNYLLIKDTILPNINIEISNRELVISEVSGIVVEDDLLEFDDDYLYDFEKYGDCYGLDELNTQLQSLKDRISAMYTYIRDSEDLNDPYYQNQKALYDKYLVSYDACEQALETRQTEYDNVISQVERYSSLMKFLASSTEKTAIDEYGNNLYGFTENELFILDKYYFCTDYVNQNIVTTSITDNQGWINASAELYNDATDELYAASHPQWEYSDTLDNILLMPEFNDWHGALDLGNFVRLHFRENDTYANERILTHGYLENNLRNLDEGYQVKLRISQISLNPFMIEDNIVLGFTQMTQYKSKRNDFITILGTSSSTGKNQISSGLSNNSNSDSIPIDTSLLMRILNNPQFTSYSNSLANTAINATSANIDNIVTKKVNAKEISADQITGWTGVFNELYSTYIEAEAVASQLVRADESFFKNLTADNGFVAYLQSVSSATTRSVIDDAYIYNAVAGKIAVGDLAAGNITLTDAMRIISENGSLVMNGKALQIIGNDKDGNQYTAIQLGYDTNETPSLILCNENGATILTPSGITSDAIADGLIVNNMVQQGSINLDRLSEPVITANQYGGVDIDQVYVGSGRFGVDYTSFKQATTDTLDGLQQQIDDNAVFDIYIDAPNGTNIRGGSITLSARLFRNNVDVTDDYDASCFTWTRQSMDTDGDTYWNNKNAAGAKSIIITPSDVHINANFRCKFEHDGIVAAP